MALLTVRHAVITSPIKRKLQNVNDFVQYFLIVNGKTEIEKERKSTDPSCMPAYCRQRITAYRSREFQPYIKPISQFVHVQTPQYSTFFNCTARNLALAK